MKPSKISPVLWIILGVSLGLLSFFLILANPFGWKFPVPSLIKTQKTGEQLPDGVVKAPTPYLFLPHGKQTYNSRTAKNNKSTISSITYDPLDPQPNSDQTISASVSSQTKVSSITLDVYTDNQTNSYPMSLTSGNTYKGTWSATFKAADTYNKIYSVSFKIISGQGDESTVSMPIR